MTRMDDKLGRIRAGHYRPADFIIADAKDGDMGSGVITPGPRRSANGAHQGYLKRRDHLDNIKSIVAQDIVDIMLVSPSNLEILVEEGVFAGSAVQPAIRANETTDIWGGIRHADYASHGSQPHRSAVLSRAMHGTFRPSAGGDIKGTDLGLYSMTFNNDLTSDLATLEAFKEFRAEAAEHGFRYFLEVFNPNAPRNLQSKPVGEFVNDMILRSLAGVVKVDRPLFLKVAYNGPKALEELVTYDPTLIVGVLGGGAGTTRDTFELVHQAERYGAKLALFGRKINLAEAPLQVVALLRQVVDGAIKPAEAVRAYHEGLQRDGMTPVRRLDDDLEITEPILKMA